MIKKIILSLVMIILVSSLLAEKSLERLGNEAEYAADELFSAKNYEKAAIKYEKAVEKFEAARDEDGIVVKRKIARVQDKLFKAYYFSGAYLKSIAVLKIQLKEDPNSSKIARTIAQIYDKKLKDLDNAIETLEKFDATNSKYIIKKKIASYYTEKKDYANALKWSKKTYKIKQDSRVIKNIASLYLKLDKKEEAVEAYENFIKTNPNERVLTRTYKNMGALYDKMNNAKKAILYYEKSNQLTYNNNITLVLITKYYDKDDYTNALKKIALLLKNKPNNSDALYYRAMINYNRGNMEKAKQDFKQITSDPRYKKIADGFIESIESE